MHYELDIETLRHDHTNACNTDLAVKSRQNLAQSVGGSSRNTPAKAIFSAGSLDLINLLTSIESPLVLG